MPQNALKSGRVFYSRVISGVLKAFTLASVIVLLPNTLELQEHRRLGSSYVPTCASGAPLPRPAEGAFTTNFFYEKLFYRRFLLHSVSQFQCGAGGALGSLGGASGAT